MPKEITLLKSDNRVTVNSTDREVFDLLEPALTYTAKKMLFGLEALRAGTKVQFTDYRMYVVEHKGRITFFVGMIRRVIRLLMDVGYRVTVRELSPRQNPPSDLVPHWERLHEEFRNITLRHGQDIFLHKVATLVSTWRYGCFDCPPGYGKSFLIGLICILYPKLKIHVVSKRVPVVCGRIYPELCQMVPSVGIYGGGKKVTGKRVMCYTVDSLTHSDGNADILIADEVHEMAADRAASLIAKYRRSVNIGLSATHNMRLDNKDLRVEAMFGPVVYSMSYAEAGEHGMVVPIEIHWLDVRMGTNPCDSTANSVERKRKGIWQNQVRNQIIANALNRLGDDVQRLITCETIEHALFLHALLPDYVIVYAAGGIDPKDIPYYRRLGVWPENHQIMTDERKDLLTRKFEAGVLKKAIATTVWNVGVSFNHLAVLARADAGASPTMDTQIPGRTSRLNPTDEKEVGIVFDCLDQFDDGFAQRAAGRRQSYANQGWTQVFPGGRLKAAAGGGKPRGKTVSQIRAANESQGQLFNGKE